MKKRLSYEPGCAMTSFIEGYTRLSAQSVRNKKTDMLLKKGVYQLVIVCLITSFIDEI